MKYLLIAFLLTCSLAPAQPTKDEKIEQLLTLTHASTMADQMMAQMRGMLESQMPPATTPEQRARMVRTQGKILDLVKTELDWTKMHPQYVKVYSETFTEAEIDGMVAFYNSPSGKAVIEKMPTIMQKMMVIVSEQMKTMMPEIEKIAKESASQ